MNVISERILQDTKLSKFRIVDMRHDEVLTAYCDNAAEFLNAHVNAVRSVRGVKREDGFSYRVQTMSAENKVVISLIKKNHNENKSDNEATDGLLCS